MILSDHSWYLYWGPMYSKLRWGQVVRRQMQPKVQCGLHTRTKTACKTLARRDCAECDVERRRWRSGYFRKLESSLFHPHDVESYQSTPIVGDHCRRSLLPMFQTRRSCDRYFAGDEKALLTKVALVELRGQDPPNHIPSAMVERPNVSTEKLPTHAQENALNASNSISWSGGIVPHTRRRHGKESPRYYESRCVASGREASGLVASLHVHSYRMRAGRDPTPGAGETWGRDSAKATVFAGAVHPSHHGRRARLDAGCTIRRSSGCSHRRRIRCASRRLARRCRARFSGPSLRAAATRRDEEVRARPGGACGVAVSGFQRKSKEVECRPSCAPLGIEPCLLDFSRSGLCGAPANNNLALVVRRLGRGPGEASRGRPEFAA